MCHLLQFRALYSLGRWATLVILLVALSEASAADFVGSKTCGACHTGLAQSQGATPMALTWRGTSTSLLPQPLDVTRSESSGSDFTFALKRSGAQLEVSASRGSDMHTTLPVDVVMGGQRHGLSFLARIDQLDGNPLARPALIEARYAWSTPKKQLALSPGFPEELPRTLDTALGVALSPTLEKRCVTCHGQPSQMASGVAGGVHCESCHGPGSDHLLAAGRGKPHEGIVNPARLDADGRMAVCAQCHTGFSHQSDPLPDDLLVSNQVNALINSECFIQSGKAVGCTSCHDPHRDSSNAQQATLQTCLGCHSATVANHAAVCPVNAQEGCVGCHMPSIQKGSFHMVDHWIRVHPEQAASVAKAGAAKPIPSLVKPLREFVRIISTPSEADAEAAAARLARGEEFFAVAREVSKDPSAPVGGYLGALYLAQCDPKLAAAAGALGYGETSKPVDLGTHWVIVHRLSRDFKYDASQLFDQGTALRSKGDLKGALESYQKALIVYPNFLRALIGMSTAFAESGNVANAAGVLNYAVQTYPDDAEAEFNFGITLGGLGRHAEEIAAFRHALDLDPDLDVAYENLGAALFATGDAKGALDTFQSGLQIDPLSATLYYDLHLVLGQEGDKAGADRALALATRIDPDIRSRSKN